MSATATKRSAASRRATANTALSGPPGTQPGTRSIRCAIYTRKSTEEGLNQEFNSLDAQRESAIAYIASQKNEGWLCISDKYDDGGFTGGNIERPALKRLMDDIEAGQVNCVVVYKVDRLSRSLMDFARLMELFDRKGVSFVSVTQQFNTTHSMGRLTLNILLSFAQFEREIISERTRDKIASARRKGKYQHGKPILGYDFVPAPAPFTGRRLVVNKAEAGRVRRIFELYLEAGSILRVADECNSRGWTTKSWTTTAGRTVGNREFDKTIVSRLLRNPLYLGKVPHNGAVYDGEHEAIIDEDLFRRVQAQLKLAGARGGASVKNSTGSLLGGLVRCKGCGCAMSPSSASKKKPDGSRTRYRYYVCCNAVKRGRQHCAAPSLPGPALEAFVLDQVKAILADSPQMAAVVARAIDLLRQAASARIAEQTRLRAVLERLSGEEPTAATRREIERVRRTLAAVSAQVAADADRLIDEDEVAGAVEAFDGVWNAMTQAERAEFLRVVIASVEYDGQTQNVSITFNPEASATETPIR
ncbi:MAG: recombinase family protein [Phycisphaeraceae bacterium]|nr:MAG: recombinase family protein [Phycisphaeraceae bacterium]